MSKKTIVFDFDGVIHLYNSGWQGATVIPDPPVEGISEAIRELRAEGYEVIVVSTRCAESGGVEAIKAWLEEYGIEVDGISAEKPPALVYVDDRAICFDGRAALLPNKIKNFKVWWTKMDGTVGQTENEQIQEMANDIAKICPDLVEDCCGQVNCVTHLTLSLSKMGYRKASEVAKEIFGEIEEVLENIGYFDEIDFKSLKKKYTEEQNNDTKITCKECKHLMFSDCYGECNKSLQIVNPDDTCEYAERKEQNSENI